jgi:hypothetical protein
MMGIRDRQSSARGEAQPATLFHAVSNNPPQESDFWSNECEGKKQPLEVWKVRYWRGFSTFDTLQQARNKAISFPKQGKYIAEIAATGVMGITYEQSFSSGHYTVWAEPAICVAHVVAIHPVHEAAKGTVDEDAL